MGGSFDVVIIGGGILGTSLSYFLSGFGAAKSVAVIEQAPRVAFHTSGRNTGKIHSPYLYDPQRKKVFARAAFYGYEMWAEYAGRKGLPFRRDGVIEVAVSDGDVPTLEKYLEWGIANGLQENAEIELVTGRQLRGMEPAVRSKAALVVRKEGSVDYAVLTQSLMDDSSASGTVFLTDTRATGLRRTGDGWEITVRRSAPGGAAGPAGARLPRVSSGTGRERGARGDGDADTVRCRFLINAAGGESVDVAHSAGVAEDVTDVHFRGEYWQAPAEYARLTSTSVYSVPDHPDYPFLDPHWIVRVDGRCEIGPNAVPVFSPYGYDHEVNLREFLPKTVEMLGSGAIRAALDRQFQNLVLHEVHSSLSKTAMINRVRKFLPDINPDKIVKRGTAGIRSSVIGADGKFVPDVMVEDDSASSLHILNYNSPGATGVLPFSVHVIDRLLRDGFLSIPDEDARCGLWRFSDVAQKLR